MQRGLAKMRAYVKNHPWQSNPKAFPILFNGKKPTMRKGQVNPMP